MAADQVEVVADADQVVTAVYTSPAIATGEAEDTRCDIYAFGVLLYTVDVPNRNGLSIAGDSDGETPGRSAGCSRNKWVACGGLLSVDHTKQQDTARAVPA